MTLKEIHIGELIKQKVTELEIPLERICKFLNEEEGTIAKMYEHSSINTHTLLRWSKLLKYDFFRIYTGHLILYSPPLSAQKAKKEIITVTNPDFRKNIYTKEVIDFILEKITTGQMTVKEVISRYSIPKTTLHKWLKKNNIQL